MQKRGVLWLFQNLKDLTQTKNQMLDNKFIGHPNSSYIDFSKHKCYSFCMRDFIFRAYCFDKNGKFNCDRASKFLGYTKSDLRLILKNDFKFIDSPDLMAGLQVGYHPTSKSPIFFAPWILKTCYHSKEDLKYMRDLICRRPDAPSWATYDFFIMNAEGKILYKNCDISQTIDENGIIHLKTKDGDLNHLVYPAERKKYPYKKFYCYGSTFQSLNSHIKSLSEKRIIRLPKHFKKGFSKTSESPLTSQTYIEKE